MVIRGNSITILNVLSNMFPDDLDSCRFRIRANAASFTLAQYGLGSFLHILGIARIIEKTRRHRQGQYLSQEGDGLLPHGVCIPHVRFYHLLERFLGSLKKIAY